jgi:protein DJ-1
MTPLLVRYPTSFLQASSTQTEPRLCTNSKMPSALILLADGSEEIEFVTPYDVLVRGGIEIKSCGVNLKHHYAV